MFIRTDRLGWNVNFYFCFLNSFSFSIILASISSQDSLGRDDLRDSKGELQLLLLLKLKLLFLFTIDGCFTYYKFRKLSSSFLKNNESLAKILVLEKSLSGLNSGVPGFENVADLKSILIFLGEDLFSLNDEILIFWPLLLHLLSIELDR